MIELIVLRTNSSFALVCSEVRPGVYFVPDFNAEDGEYVVGGERGSYVVTPVDGGYELTKVVPVQQVKD